MAIKDLRKDSDASNSSLTGSMRNSNIELLRLIAMFMIVVCHCAYSTDNGMWVTLEPLSFNKFIFQVVFLSGGWIGNVIFFTISVWFLLDKHITIKNSFKRIWLLERELLFWSLILFTLTLFLKKMNIYDGEIISLAPKSVLPLSFDLWWYPTSYALFLLLLPYLSRGLQSLGKRMHQALAMSLLFIWGIAALIPKIEFNLNKPSVFTFLYLFILIAYYKWYMKDFSNRTCAWMIVSGVAVNVVYWLIASTASQRITQNKSSIHALHQLQNYLQTRCSLTEIAIGFSIFLLFSRKIYYSKLINVLAASAFGAYLIHCYPSINRVWLTILPASRIYQSPYAILIGLLWALTIFIICLTADLLRQGLFAITINRHRGKWFEHLYYFIYRTIKHTSQSHGRHRETPAI
ncbi:acyltransferase family protein [Bifidobacterium animalis]|uniref:acyltransferase family protein n=1 Tax=Bifidobacterium animalis TaxID=28025 RepID=UPI0009BC3A58|nr:acyltransferase family protein [Bifidobacterium animalis]